MNHEFNPWRRLALGVSLVAFFIAVYFLTYSGYPISDDERFLFDATESLARRGDLQLNYQLHLNPPVTLEQVGVPVVDAEPLQPVLAAPLFLIAQALPGIGLMHSVWLFNVLLTALIVGTFYVYGLGLGYRARVAALAALMLGLGTIIWPYSKTFFREPLFTWLALLSLFLLMRIRRKWTASEPALLTLLLFVIVFAAALFAKEAAFLIIPALMVEALPSRLGRITLTRRGVLLVFGLLVFGVALLLIILNADTLFGISERYAFSERLQQIRINLSDMSSAIYGYLFSAKRSMWLYSPLLLMGFAGWRRLARRHHWREILMPLVMLVSFVVGYAAVRGAAWSGGLGWGPRYLVPLTPILALWFLPVIEVLLEKGTLLWARLAVGLFFVISTALQVLAVLIPVGEYYTVLKEHTGVFPLWSLVARLGDQKVEFAWVHAVENAWMLPVACGVLAVCALIWLVWWIRHTHDSIRLAIITAVSLMVFVALTLGIGLYAIRLDPRYYGDFPRTRELLAQLKAEARPDDVIVLNDYTYTEFFMNYYKQSEPVVYTLPLSPGERFSLDQPPQIESANPDELIHPSDTVILARLAEQHDRLWLVINSNRFISWSVRPVEHYLARHYFPVSEVQSADTARAVLFDMTSALPTGAWSANAVDATFGESLRLAGYDLPGGVTRRAGDVLPVSLLWEAVNVIPQDYSVGLFLMSPEGALVTQHDSYPVNYFEFTHNWRVGSYHRDNHGLQLPANLPPGEYELWAVVYWWQEPAERLPVTTRMGEPIGDHIVLTTIIVPG